MRSQSGLVAMERLRVMLGNENQMLDDQTLEDIRKDIGDVVLNYVDVDPENVDIRIILREYKKKIIC